MSTPAINPAIAAVLRATEKTLVGERMMLLQCERHRAGLPMVTCECRDAIGPVTARISGAGTHWLCGGREESTGCAFGWPVEDTLGAPVRLVADSPPPPSPLSQLPQSAPPAKTPLEIVAEECNIDLEQLEPLRFAQLRGFVKHWHETYEAPLTRDYLDEWFPKWLDQQAKEKEAVCN